MNKIKVHPWKDTSLTNHSCETTIVRAIQCAFKVKNNMTPTRKRKGTTDEASHPNLTPVEIDNS